MPTYERRSELDHPVEEVFAWHLRPGAFERLVPPWASVQVVAREGGPSDGGEVTLTMRRGPLKLDWVVRHTAFEENRFFRDEQVSGPFRTWVHTHRFEPLGPARCAIVDEIEWDLPLDPVTRSFGGGFVETEIDRLFTFRHRRLAHDLALLRRYGTERPLTVAITGSSGLVGSALGALLRSQGHSVLRLVRSREAAQAPDAAYWKVTEGTIDARALEGIDAVVHLAGESIAGLRWTEEKKRRIRESRVEGTRILAEALARLDRRPRVLVSASGVHYYGDRGDEILTEESGPGRGFLAEVTRGWEDATRAAEEAGIRVVRTRSGIVLSPEGGPLSMMLTPFKLGLGGRFGSGRQYMSWVDADDSVGLILHAILEERVRGPMNVTSPYPVPNATFVSTLGRVLRRPTLIPLPSFAVRAGMGEMGEELLLHGQRAVPQKARETGYTFLVPGLEESLRFELGRGG